jgi:hypothetical protein
MSDKHSAKGGDAMLNKHCLIASGLCMWVDSRAGYAYDI